VEIDGREYTFGSGGGIFSTNPRDVPNAQFRESIELGTFYGTSRDIDRAIDELRSSFHGSSYNLLTKNCNHFSDALCNKLLEKPIPGYVNRLANLGGMVSCLLPPTLTGQAPVDQQQPMPYGTSNRTSTIETPMFSGKGFTLGIHIITHTSFDISFMYLLVSQMIMCLFHYTNRFI
jgi:hypothetical protein